MKQLFLIIVITSCNITGFAQKEGLIIFEKERIRITKNSMLVLGGWSAANLIGSGIATKTSNTEMRYFHQMNVMWGGINLGIAALGYIGAANEKVKDPVMAGIIKHQNKLKKTYLINLGLDAVYIGSGLLMNTKSDNQKNPAKFRGYGNSIMLQGGFLMLYDAANYFIHRQHGKQLDKFIGKVQFGGGPGALSLVYDF